MSTPVASKIIYLASIIPDLLTHVQRLLPNVSIVHIEVKNYKEGCTAEIKDKIKDAEILLAEPRLLEDLLYETSIPLKFVNCSFAGIDRLIGKLDPSKGYPDFTLTRTGQGYDQVMGEYVIGHIIAKERRFRENYINQINHTWAQNDLKRIRPLLSLNIGIIGLGSIGKGVARMCKTMGMTVTGIKRKDSTTPSCQYIDTYGYVESLKDVLPNCDYICSILPSTPHTINMLSGDLLSCCSRKKPVFINIGRGDVIDEETLVAAIRNEWLSGAILDVFQTEPLPASSVLWDLPNVTITPHVSGPSLPQQVAESFVENYKRYIHGEKLLYQVDWQKGY